MKSSDQVPRLIAAASLPRTARLAGQFADGVNFTWFYADRIPGLFAALDEGLKQSGRSREGFDCSLHVRWNNLHPDPRQALTEWEQMGFSRVIVYITELFPITEISELVRLM